MIFSELVDLVLLNVNGGRFSGESSVIRVDVESYVPAACHAVIRKSIFEARQLARAESEPVSIDGGYYQTYILPVKEDTDRKVQYVALPGVLQSLPAKHSIDSVSPEGNPSGQFYVIQGPAFITDSADGLFTQCWHEVHGEESRIYIYGGKSLCNVVVRVAMSISSMLGDSHLPLPIGLEYEVIVACVEHFRQQKITPQDVVLDNKDSK